MMTSMPIIPSSEDFDWNNMVAALPNTWLSTREFNMRKLVIEDVAVDPLAPQAAVAEPIQTEKELKDAAKAAKELKDAAKAAKEAAKQLALASMGKEIKAQFDIEGHPEVRLVKAKTKVPVFQDVEKQKEVCAKFPWVIPGTFAQDPEKSGGTLLAIKCEGCGDERIIHLADAFHTKKCKTCKKNGTNKKLDQQQPSGLDSQPGATVDIK